VILAVDLGKTSCRAAAAGRRAEGKGAPGLAAPGGVRAAEAAILAVARDLGPADEVIVGAAGALIAPDAARALNARGDALRERLNALCRKHDAPMQFTGIGSMLAVHMTRAPVLRPEDAAKADPKLKELFFFDMLERGIWLARRGMINLSLPMGDSECDSLAGAVQEFLSSRRSVLAGFTEPS
jgi:hypothetical protein